jgi:16S rRNA (uracil1498-N3)-methyltransferase
MPRVFVPEISVLGPEVTISGQEAHYLLAVLRCGPGDELMIFDSRGGRFRARVRKTGRKEVVVELTESLPPEDEPAHGVNLLQGVLKGPRMDLVVQKATELGVRNIFPLITRRTQVSDTGRHVRWQKIALEASRQSGRPVAPEVMKPVTFEEFFGSVESGLRGFIFWEEGGRPLRKAFKGKEGFDIHVAIGPEGGFTNQETSLAQDKGLVITTLGHRVLRAETAAISALSLVQFLLGEMGG